MLTVIYGGSGSGKSAYAEYYMEQIAGVERRYYLATMQVFDDEGRKKVEKHRKMRAGKGFLTLEQPRDIADAGRHLEQPCSMLLECMSNLAANEMFQESSTKPCDAVVEKILCDTAKLEEQVTELVIVTNNVFEDGICYDEMTMEYLQAMGRINEKLAAMADQVIEVVVGIPIVIKNHKEGI